MNIKIHIPRKIWKRFSKLVEKKSKKGRPDHCIRKTLEGIYYVLKTGCQWGFLPPQFGAPSTVHGKFMKWSREGIFEKMLVEKREEYFSAQEIQNWIAFDTSSRKAPRLKSSGKCPTDRGKRGVKIAVMVDRKGKPLYVDVFPANRHDSKTLLPVINRMHNKDIKILAADSAFDTKNLRKVCLKNNIILLASTNSRRNKNVKKYHPLHRWIVERTFGWFPWFRGIATCHAKTSLAYLSFLQIACIDLLSR
jgi:putative transposase